MGKFLISIAILLVFGNLSFANLSFDGKEKTTVISDLQTDENGKPFVFNEISIGEASQTVSQNEYLGFGIGAIFSSNQNFSLTRDYSIIHSSFILKDKRELIFRHLFPFHFFW
ncbi:hypothetical protein QRD02_02375 [Aequorivita sp. SDUM287046]|uniref:Outer membrane protein beta-barrel domain-containing protein n=1 Tax=Aequorivita aurantiaca TaxID=3053356 RepID=A0ABT8DGZ3_9FLAO|nr:hypothetical protein [Aequorivita aurantiaca]MDN3723214.1 hypothetical protein [Aequorivita aurantiaca]